MAALHERLLSVSAKRNTCKVCVFLHGLTEAAREEWRAELAYPVDIIGNEAVAIELRSLGLQISSNAVKAHRTNHR